MSVHVLWGLAGVMTSCANLVKFVYFNLRRALLVHKCTSCKYVGLIAAQVKGQMCRACVCRMAAG